MPAGNLRRLPLQKIWRDAEIFAQLRALRVDDVFVLPDSQARVMNFFCPLLSQLESGSLTTQSAEAARFNRILARTCGEGSAPGMGCGQ
jgi:hypothetical protein